MKNWISWLDPRPMLSLGWSSLTKGWRDFWFAPQEPLVLGFLRFFAGLVLLHVLVASTPLLTMLYTAQGLVDLDTINQIRKEVPWMVSGPEWLPEDGSPGPLPPVLRPEVIPEPGREAYMKTWGVDRSLAYDQGMPLVSPLFHIGDPTTIYCLHALAILVALAFTVGLGGRVVTVLAWFVGLSYMHRGLPSAFGMDTMLGIVLFYLMVGPSTRALSLDRLITRYRQTRHALALRQPLPDLVEPPSASANLALRLLQCHFCIIYLLSGTSKLQGAAWWNGTAIWQTLSNFEFAPARFQGAEAGLQLITQNRIVFELFIMGGTIFTLALEIGLPFLIWYPRWRPVMITGAVLLHAGIGGMMGLLDFSLLMMIIVGSFFPASAIRALVQAVLKSPQPLWVLFHSRDEVGPGLAALARAVDFQSRVHLVDLGQSVRAEVEPDWLVLPAHLHQEQLVLEGEPPRSGFDAFVRLCQVTRLLWPIALLLRVPGVVALGRAVWPNRPQPSPAREMATTS